MIPSIFLKGFIIVAILGFLFNLLTGFLFIEMSEFTVAQFASLLSSLTGIFNLALQFLGLFVDIAFIGSLLPYFIDLLIFGLSYRLALFITGLLVQV